MTTSQDIGDYRLSPSQAAAMGLLEIGSFPARRLYLHALDDKFDLSREDWKRVLESLRYFDLVNHQPFTPNPWCILGPTYGLTEAGIYLAVDNRLELSEYAMSVTSLSV